MADEFSKAGLEAFATYWYATLSYGFETGDMSPMEAVTDPSCTTCSKVKAGITPWHQEGRWTIGGQMTVNSVQSNFVETPDGTFQAIASVSQGQLDYVRADKSVAQSLAKTPPISDIIVAKFIEGKWLALTVEHLAGK
ncbi:MAG: hypothetical protein HIU81_07990 [Acidobacteria bacterium]|nr:hypothetical protein [Acidobacteriota bacterium]